MSNFSLSRYSWLHFLESARAQKAAKHTRDNDMVGMDGGIGFGDRRMNPRVPRHLVAHHHVLYKEVCSSNCLHHYLRQ
jgi:hypothetical protein